MDPGLNNLLKWGIENTPKDPSNPDTTNNNAQPAETAVRSINADALRALMGGPSDADMMVQSMASIKDPNISLEDKLVAFDNFEQLIENLDNANNMESLKLWTPMVDTLADPEPELKRYACWCIGTAVQNNAKSQERVRQLQTLNVLHFPPSQRH